MRAREDKKGTDKQGEVLTNYKLKVNTDIFRFFSWKVLVFSLYLQCYYNHFD
jgi:hypothetical protein